MVERIDDDSAVKTLYQLILGRRPSLKELKATAFTEESNRLLAVMTSLYESKEQAPHRYMTAVIDISNKCNLRCRMCYFSHDSYYYVKPGFMSPETFTNVADVVLPHAGTLTLSCGSEPLCSPYFVEILKITSKYELQNLDFCTNGILLTKKRADAVIESGVTEIMFSVDAATKETYEYIRRGADFGRLLRNIEYLVKRKEAAGLKIPRLRFNVTLMQKNIAELADLVTLAANLGVTSLDFRHLVVYEGLGVEKESLVHNKQLANYWLDVARARAGELGLEVVACPENFSADASIDERKTQKRGWKDRLKFLKPVKQLLRPTGKKAPPAADLYCNLPFTYVLVNSAGGVFPCPHCHGVQPFGLLSESPFGKIWLNDKYMNLRSRILENNPPEMCQRCPSAGKGKVENSRSFESRQN